LQNDKLNNELNQSLQNIEQVRKHKLQSKYKEQVLMTNENRNN